MKLLYIEPFDSGSHRQFTETLTDGLDADLTVLTLPGRHWKWRMRGSGVWFAQQVRQLDDSRFDGILASAFLPLGDFIAACPELATVPVALYFHENQLVFPVLEDRERDHHFGFTQLVSARLARRCLFNSAWNRDSFLDEGGELLARMPDAVVPGWIDDVAAKSRVVSFPLALPDELPEPAELGDRTRGPVILWNHRWEHDKAPTDLFEVLFELHADKVPFRLAVCGKRFTRAPAIFAEARRRLAERIVHWGHVPSRRDYWAIVAASDLAVSTAVHEFFGVSMLEAAWAGARLLVPNRLSYVELVPDQFRYDSRAELAHRLESWCRQTAPGAWSRGELRHIAARHRADVVLERLEREIRETIGTAAVSSEAQRIPPSEVL